MHGQQNIKILKNLERGVLALRALEWDIMIGFVKFSNEPTAPIKNTGNFLNFRMSPAATSILFHPIIDLSKIYYIVP